MTKNSNQSQESIESPKSLLKKGTKKKMLKSKKEIKLTSKLIDIPIESVKSLDPTPPIFTLSQSAHDSQPVALEDIDSVSSDDEELDEVPMFGRPSDLIRSTSHSDKLEFELKKPAFSSLKIRHGEDNPFFNFW